MPQVWVLLFVTGSTLGTAPASMLAGFNSLAACEHSRAQLIEKMNIRKSACIEITGAGPVPPPPVDQDH